MTRNQVFLTFCAGLAVGLLAMFGAAALAGMLTAELRPAAGLLVSLTMLVVILLIISFYVWLFSPYSESRKEKRQ